MQKVSAIWLFLMVLLPTFSLFAQDVSWPGPVGCSGMAVTGTWDVPCGVTSITVEVYGGGGGAGGGGGGNSGGLYQIRGGGGGGGAAYTVVTINVTPGSSFIYSVGAGGCGGSNGVGSNNGDNGEIGGNSTFWGTDAGGSPVNLTANGGDPGLGGDGTGGNPGTGGAGGSAIGGTTNTAGISGFDGNGSDGGVGGAGAGPSGGLGGASDGGAGSTFGAGGGGGNNSDGGNGAAGGILITYVNQGAQITPPITATIVGTGPLCNGGSDGSVDLTVSGGAAPFSFLWSSGSTLEDPSGLDAGTNTVTITDANNCVVTESFILTEPTLVYPNAYATFVSGPGSCDGSGVSNPSGGTAPYTYSWSNGQTTQTATALCEGPHTVTVTDANGCTASQIITVSIPTCLSDVNFYTWVQAGQPANGNWTVQNGGAQVHQTINGNPTFYVTPVNYINVGMKGKIRTTDSDNDFMGVVFGFNNPMGASNDFDMWLLDWKQATENGAQEGFALNHVVGTISNYNTTFWEHISTAEFDVVATNYGNNGWSQNVDHEIEVVYTLTRAVILVDGDTIFDVADCFEPGRFGFYNYSQQDVIYSDFSYELFADFTADGQVTCEGETGHFNFLEQCGQFDNLSQFEELQWDFGDGQTENVTNINLSNVNPTHLYSGVGDYLVQLIAIDTLGCIDTAYRDVTVFQNPSADFGAADQCFPDSLEFSDLSVQGDFAITGWSWDLGDNSTGNQPGFYHHYSASGTYDVLLVVEDSNGCVDSVEQAVTIHEIPVVDFSFTDICEDDSIQFVDQSTILSGSISGWEWSFGNGNTASVADPVHQHYAVDSTYTISLIVSTDIGCSDTLEETIEIFPVPIANLTFDSVCFPLEIQFTDLSDQNGAYGLTGWSWNFSDGQTSNLQSPSIDFGLAGTFSADLEVTNAVGCENSFSAGDAVIHSVPVTDFPIGLATCFEDTVFLDGQASIIPITNDVIASWSWDFDDGNTSGLPSPFHIYGSQGHYNVEFTAVSNHGCMHATTRMVEVYPLPLISFTPMPDEGCLPLEVAFDNQTSIDQGYYISDYYWDLGNGDISIAQFPQTTYVDSGLYDVMLIASTTNGCYDTLTITEAVEVWPNPIAGFETDKDHYSMFAPKLYCEDLSSGATEWHWDFADGSQSTDQNPNHEYEQAGTYMVVQVVSNDYGCEDMHAQEVIVDPVVTFYIPNSFSPNDDRHNETFAGIGEGIADYEMWVFDRWGEKLFYSAEASYQWDGTFNGKPVESGVYSYRFELIDAAGEFHRYTGAIRLIR